MDKTLALYDPCRASRERRDGLGRRRMDASRPVDVPHDESEIFGCFPAMERGKEAESTTIQRGEVTSMPTSDLRDLISQRAYQIWEEEGRPEGRQEEHWVRAEMEVLGGPGTGRKTRRKAPASSKAKESRKKASSLTKIVPDDLTQIKGIGANIAAKLNEIGITTFAQIAGWKRKVVDEVDQKLALKGRIARQEWVKQAKKLIKR